MDNFIAHILVVDDDDGIRSLVKKYLNENGFLVSTANSAEEASEKIKIVKFDLIILDIMMPGKNGLEFIEENKKKLETPIILLTAKGEANERIEGLETGADDYVAKPFEPRELILRIKRILARQKLTERPNLVHFGMFSYDTGRQILMEDGLRVHITTAEQDLLHCFTAAPNEVLSRQNISDSLKGRMNGRSIDVAVARLRTKLERDSRFPVFLQTVRGKGWMLRTN